MVFTNGFNIIGSSLFKSFITKLDIIIKNKEKEIKIKLITLLNLFIKIAEVFFDEMISYIKVNTVTDDTLVVFDQFSIILDETGRYESIEINEFLQKTIESLYAGILSEEERLKREDDEFAENKSK